MKAAIAVLLLASTGCSWIAVRPPPAHPDPRYPVDCTSSPAAPLVDASIALLLVGTAIAEDNDQECDTEGFCFDIDLTPLFVLPAIVLGLSSITGFSRNADCNAAIARHPVR